MTLRLRPLAAALLLAGLGSGGTLQAEEERAIVGAHLQGLDKITARIFNFEAPIAQTVRFGYLQIEVADCVVSAEEEAPERTAFLRIVEAKPDRDPVVVFSGWMFASSPSVSAMEHAVYDVWVVNCLRVGDTVGPEPSPVVELPEDRIEAPVDGVERPLD